MPARHYHVAMPRGEESGPDARADSGADASACPVFCALTTNGPDPAVGDVLRMAALLGEPTGSRDEAQGGGELDLVCRPTSADAPGLRVRPVEPATSDDVVRSLAAGERLANEGPITSICDAIVTPSPGELTFPVMRRLCGSGLSVTDDEALWAVAQIFLRLKLVAEPGGAVAVAAALVRGDEIEGDTVICTISGGNTDPAMFMRALATLEG